MNELPELALIRIFNGLPLYDQLAGRLVCKLWKTLIENDLLANSRKELILFLRMTQRPLIWSHSQQPINLDNSIVVNGKFKTSNSFKALFFNKKRLYIAQCYGYDTFEEFDYLNDFVPNFPNLEHLEINNLFYVVYQENTPRLTVDFSHPNLRTLYLGYKDQLVRLNCPSLTDLSVYSDFHLAERSPGSLISNNIRFLKVLSFSHQPRHGLPSLEVLHFSVSLQINIVDFPKLKEIHYDFRFLEFEGNQLEQILNLESNLKVNVRATFSSLLQRKMSLKRHLEIYYNGIRCRSLDQIRSLENILYPLDLSKEELEQLIEGSDELRLGIAKRRLDADELKLVRYRNQLTGDSIKRLARATNYLGVGRRACQRPPEAYYLEDRSFDLTAKAIFEYVRYLDLAPALPQNLLDRLPDILPNLVYIWSKHGHSLENRTKNYFFLRRFLGLKQLHMDRDWLSIDVLREIYKNCKFLDYITLIDNEQPMTSIYWSDLCDHYVIVPDINQPIGYEVPSKEELLELLERKQLIKRNFFDNYFSQNYFLLKDPNDFFKHYFPEDVRKKKEDYLLTITDHFNDQSH